MSEVLISSAPLHTAVLFLVFNRPNTTKQVFEAIRQARPPKIYVASDGARENIPGETERVEEVRRIVSDVDWPCEIKTLYRHKNLGCKEAIFSAINWFFENEEQGIIIEDDCLPSAEFFPYCEFYLDKYKYDDNIFSISGSRFGLSEKSCFSKYALMWGWATWRDRWKYYSLELEGVDEVCKKKFSNLSTRLYWRKIFKDTNAGLIDTWDYQWIYCVMLNNGFVVRPNYNTINNIGFGEGATHTLSYSHGKIINSFQKAKINLNSNLTYNISVDKEDEKFWLGLTNIRRIKIIIKELINGA